MATTQDHGKDIMTEKSIRIGDFFYNIASDDDYITNIGDTFEPHMCALFKSLVRSDHTVYDVGSNIGCTTILFGNLARHVESFEPSPTTFKILERNVIASSLSNINVHNYGLGSVDESLTLTFSPFNRSGAFVSDLTQASAGHTVESIEIRRGDTFPIDRDPDFIKIDVEGYEKNVIEGLRNVINRSQPIVVLELNHWCLNAFQRVSIPDFFDFLISVFPILYAIDGNRYLSLHDQSERYICMYRHINQSQYPNILGAFSSQQLLSFESHFIREV